MTELFRILICNDKSGKQLYTPESHILLGGPSFIWQYTQFRPFYEYIFLKICYHEFYMHRLLRSAWNRPMR